MIEIAVTDAHALIWYGTRRWKKLGPQARKVFEAVDAGAATIYVPTLALVEISEASHHGRISLQGGFSSWTDKIFSTRRFMPVDLTVDIVRRAEAFYGIPERDDRLIAATAAHLGFPLITRDPEIARAAGVEVVW
jgi:PIN domain nuclease of toxin-antitoxin system